MVQRKTDVAAFAREDVQKAIADAQTKASQLADLAGVKIGKPTYISESAQLPPPIYAEGIRMAAAAPMDTPISPGEMEISLTIQLVYAIAD